MPWLAALAGSAGSALGAAGSALASGAGAAAGAVGSALGEAAGAAGSALGAGGAEAAGALPEAAGATGAGASLAGTGGAGASMAVPSVAAPAAGGGSILGSPAFQAANAIAGGGGGGGHITPAMTPEGTTVGAVTPSSGGGGFLSKMKSGMQDVAKIVDPNFKNYNDPFEMIGGMVKGVQGLLGQGPMNPMMGAPQTGLQMQPSRRPQLDPNAQQLAILQAFNMQG